MADPRRMKRATGANGGGRLTREEWRRFDLSKAWVWIGLIVLALILLFLRGCNPQVAGTVSTPTAAAVATEILPTKDAPTEVAPTDVAAVTATMAAPTNTPVPPDPTSTAAPAEPPSVDPQDGVIPAGAVSFGGSAAPGAEVDVQIDGVSVGKAKADAQGRWSLDVELKAGDHEVVVVGPDGSASKPEGFQIGSGAGPDPVAVSEPAAGGSVAPGPLTLSGTAGPSADLVVLVDGKEVGRVQADAQGAWTADIDLPEGAHSIVVAPVSADGTVFNEAASAPLDVTAEAQGVAPTFTQPESPKGLAVGPVIFRGTAAPGSTITLSIDGKDARTVTAEDDGSWSAQIDVPSGDHEVVATSVQPDGLKATSEAFAISAAAVKPAITSPAAGNVTSGNVVLRGTASPGQDVEIVVDGKVVGTTTSDARGNWFLSTPLTAGARSVVARYAGSTAADDSSEAIAYTVQQRRAGGQCRNTTPIPAEVSRYTVEVNDTLYCISQRSGLSIAAIKRDNPFITDENLILPGQVLTLRERTTPATK